MFGITIGIAAARFPIPNLVPAVADADASVVFAKQVVDLRMVGGHVRAAHVPVDTLAGQAAPLDRR